MKKLELKKREKELQVIIDDVLPRAFHYLKHPDESGISWIDGKLITPLEALQISLQEYQS